MKFLILFASIVHCNIGKRKIRVWTEVSKLQY